MAKRYLVTGGGGFVGKALCKELRRQGHEVVSLSRGRYPDLEAIGVHTKQIDIGSNMESWAALFEGIDGVFHTAAKVDMWGDYQGFYRTNVLGTRNILMGCQRSGIKSLVFTSSPSVIHTGKDLVNVDESTPYPKHYHAYYPETKAKAEQEVLAADRQGGLRTVALRPHLIWGPNDTNLIPTVVERAKIGRLTRIGSGGNLVDLTFIDDCVNAHILAMKALESTPQNAGGKAYFISQGDPVKMWRWIDEVLAAHGLPPVQKSIPTPLAYGMASIMEVVANTLSLVGVQMKPLLTRFLVSEMSTHHYFNIAAAKRDFGYHPSCSIAGAMHKTFGESKKVASA
jgi:nucleoside-diphosphate-sugar epimerase